MVEFIADNEFYSRRPKPATCQKQPDANGWWICHYCGSMWSEMLSGTGWIPLSCPARRAVSPHDRGGASQ